MEKNTVILDLKVYDNMVIDFRALQDREKRLEKIVSEQVEWFATMYQSKLYLDDTDLWKNEIMDDIKKFSKSANSDAIYRIIINRHNELLKNKNEVEENEEK